MIDSSIFKFQYVTMTIYYLRGRSIEDLPNYDPNEVELNGHSMLEFRLKLHQIQNYRQWGFQVRM